MELNPKEIAKIVILLKDNGCEELSEKVLKHFEDINNRFAEVYWTKDDVENAFDTNGDDSPPTDEQIQRALDNIEEDHMKEMMIEVGWEHIYQAVDKVTQHE